MVKAPTNQKQQEQQIENLMLSLNINHFTNTANLIHINSSFKPTYTGTTDSVNGISSTNVLSSLNTDHFTNTGKRIYIDRSRYNERINIKTKGSKTFHI